MLCNDDTIHQYRNDCHSCNDTHEPTKGQVDRRDFIDILTHHYMRGGHVGVVVIQLPVVFQASEGVVSNLCYTACNLS